MGGGVGYDEVREGAAATITGGGLMCESTLLTTSVWSHVLMRTGDDNERDEQRGEDR